MKKNNSPVQFGYSEIDITPDRPVVLVGFSRVDNTSKGILHQLKAQALLCKSENQTCCLITIDSIGFTIALTNELRDLIANDIGISREQIMVCFSHTHAAPDAGIDHQYYTFVCSQTIACVRKAIAYLSPQNAAWGVTDCEVGINRRGQQSPVDKRLGILKIEDYEKQTKLILVRVTAHANVLSSDNYLISADYFGITRKLLEQTYGCKVMMVQGAAGDIRPKYQQENAEYLEIHGLEASKNPYPKEIQQKYYLQSLDALNQMAQTIYHSVDSILDKIKPVPVYRLSMFSKSCQSDADVPTKERAVEIASEAKEAGIDGTDWLLEVEELHKKKITVQSKEVEIQYFVLNDGCLCGVANEIMTEMALDVQKQANQPLLFFNGYVNGIDSYLPTAREYDKGGYEVLWSNLIYFKYHGRVMPFNRDTGKKLSDVVVDIWKKRGI